MLPRTKLLFDNEMSLYINTIFAKGILGRVCVCVCVCGGGGHGCLSQRRQVWYVIVSIPDQCLLPYV